MLALQGMSFAKQQFCTSTMNKGFDWVAPVYSGFETLAHGDALSVARLAFIETVLKAQRVLLIGEGDGRFLAACLANKIEGSITVIDSSAQMLRLLERRIRNIDLETELKLVHTDFLQWDAGSALFDVVVTHFFLDLFRPPTQRRVVDKLTTLTHTETDWVDVDGLHTGHSTAKQRWIERFSYGFDQLFSGVEVDRYYDPLPVIYEGGWTVKHKKSFLGGAVLARVLRRRPEF